MSTAMAGPLQPEQIGNPAGGDAQRRCPCRDRCRCLAGVADQHAEVVAGADADEDAGRVPSQFVGATARRLPAPPS